MPMTTGHATAHEMLGYSASTLDERTAAFVVAKAAADSAAANLANARTALDAAVVDFNAKNATFASQMLTFPAGYTPPA